ncbi:hypothetical protein RYX36_030943 [Vicia faba]
MAEEDKIETETETELEEEFSVWKRNTPLLYDLFISHPLSWPSLTVQWLPASPQPHSHPSFNTHKLLIATHTSNEEPNYLMLADSTLPVNPSQPIYSEDPENPFLPKVEITQRVLVDGEVNRARSMPQNPSIVAAKTCNSEVYVFDFAKKRGDSNDPDFRLKGHEEEGYGLAWSPFKKGYLLSGSNDHKICLWDVFSESQNNVLDAVHVYEGHESIVEDVSWHTKDENLFGSGGDDCRLIIWDLRTNKAQQSLKPHEREVNFVSFNPYNEWILATASSDTTVGLFDIRKLEAPLHFLSSHTDEVFQVEWDPNHDGILASSSSDRRLMVWDLNRIGDEMIEGDEEGGPPELLFSHGGHKGKISDFSWNQHQPWVISSVAEDNSFHVWQMAESIYNDGDVDDDNSWLGIDQQ